jgi:CcmD family protein
MIHLRTLLRLLTVTVWLAGSAGAQPAPSPTPTPSPEQQSEFVPISELPPQDQLPAAPLLVAAYAVVWLALFGYLYSVARRLRVVQREVERLESDLTKRGG